MEKDKIHDSDQLQAMTKEKLIALVIELKTENNRIRNQISKDNADRLALDSIKETLKNTLTFIEDIRK